MTRTLAKMQAVSSPTIEDQVDGMHRFGEHEISAAGPVVVGSISAPVAGAERPVSRSEVASPELTANR